MDGLLSDRTRDLISLFGLAVAIYQVLESVGARSRNQAVRSPPPQQAPGKGAGSFVVVRSIEKAFLDLGKDYLRLGVLAAIAALLAALSAAHPPGLHSQWVGAGLVGGAATQWVFLLCGVAVRMSVRQRAKPRLGSRGWAAWALASLLSVAGGFFLRPTIDPASPVTEWLPLLLWAECISFVASSAGALVIVAIAATFVRALIRRYKGTLTMNEVLALRSNFATWKRLLADVDI